MKKNILVFVIIILNLSLYAQKIAQLNAVKIKEENIYIVEDKLDILKSKKDAEVYIEKAFACLLQDGSDFLMIYLAKRNNIPFSCLHITKEQKILYI